MIASSRTTFTLATGQSVIFKIGGSGTATVFVGSLPGQSYVVGQQEAFIGPFTASASVVVDVANGSIEYVIDGDGVLEDKAPAIVAINERLNVFSSSGLLCAVIGDSRNAQNRQDLSAGGVDSLRKSNQGALTWLQFITFQKVDIPWEYNLAVSGTGTAAIAAKVADVLALPVRPRLCFINGGTNSFATNATYAQAVQSLADISGAAVALRAAGIEPVIELDHPRTLASWTSAAAKTSAAYNRMIREWCYTNGYRCADVETVAAQLSGANAGDPVSGYMLAIAGDSGMHRVATGALVSALALKAAIDDLLTPIRERTSGGAADAYDAIYHPYGSILSNGMFFGTSGTNTGTGASGTAPDSWNNRVISGTMTCVSSLESRTDGRLGQNWVQTISASAAGTTRASQINNPVTTGKFAAGDKLVAEVDCEITALTGSVEYVRLFLQDYDGASISGAAAIDLHNAFSTAGQNPMPTLPLARNSGGNWLTSIKGRLRTPPMTLGQGITSAQALLRMETSVGAGGAVTVKWGDATLRKFA